MKVIHDRPAQYTRILKIAEIPHDVSSAANAMQELATALENIKSAYVEQLQLELPYQESDNTLTISLLYWEQDLDDLKVQKEAKENAFRQDVRIVGSPADKVMLGTEEMTVLELRNSAGENQDNTSSLLRKAALELSNVPKAKLLDLTYHEFTEGNGVDRPYIRIYLQNQLQ